MSLKAAISFLKALPDRADTYTFNEGWVYARSPSLFAGYPVPHMLGTFALSAPDLERTIARLGAEPKIEAGDGTIILRAGRLKSSIDLIDAEAPADLPDLSVAPDPMPAGLTDAIEKALPFVGVEGTWQRTMELRTGIVRAVNSAYGVEVKVESLDLDSPVALTRDAVSYLLSLDPPAGIVRLPSSVSFSWLSGAWLKCQLSTYAWPDAIVARVFDLAKAATPVAITQEWRETFDTIASLGDGTVELSPNAIRSKTNHANHEAEFPTGVAAATRWKIEALAKVVKIADSFAPDASGPAAFVGEGLRGVVVALRSK